MNLKFLADKCTGCQLCRLACSAQKENAFYPARARLKVESYYDTSGLRVEGRVCDNCGACIEVCPVEAISRLDGRLHVDPDMCTQCGACIEECPHGVIVDRGDEAVGICDLCGGDPQCVDWCPVGAVVLEVGQCD
ncbi:MAG: 4Fe-4S binding protein [Bacillota bacterium]